MSLCQHTHVQKCTGIPYHDLFIVGSITHLQLCGECVFVPSLCVIVSVCQETAVSADLPCLHAVCVREREREREREKGMDG